VQGKKEDIRKASGKEVKPRTHPENQSQKSSQITENKLQQSHRWLHTASALPPSSGVRMKAGKRTPRSAQLATPHPPAMLMQIHANPWKSPVTLLTWQETDPNGNAGRTNVLKIDQEANEKPHLCALSQALGTRNQMGQNKKHTRTHTHRETHRNTLKHIEAHRNTR
jgi:hypothetical protein